MHCQGANTRALGYIVATEGIPFCLDVMVVAIRSGLLVGFRVSVSWADSQAI